MRSMKALTVLVVLAGGVTAATVVAALARPASGEAPAGDTVPVLVELFTSEGCSSCPPADALLQRLVETQPVTRAQIIALGEHVDYWDRLGWKDRFSSAALTSRQQVYGARFNTDSVYTPQMVVDGSTEFVGSDASAARRALERAVAAPHGRVRVALDEGTNTSRGDRSLAVTVTASDLPREGADRADVVLAITEDRLRSDVTRGENHGRVLTHAAVVRYLAPAGEAARDTAFTTHAEIPIGADWQRSHLNVVAFVQERRSRTVLAAAVLPVVVR
jgi:hypothetical protein